MGLTLFKSIESKDVHSIPDHDNEYFIVLCQNKYELVYSYGK